MTILGASHFPIEVFEIILGHLPESQIARCREVCRNWRETINQIPSFCRFERSLSLLRGAIKIEPRLFIPLPQALGINPVKIFPFESCWAIESLAKSGENDCFLLPGLYLGKGTLSLQGGTLFRRESNHLHLYTSHGHKKIGVALAEIGKTSHLVLTSNGIAALFRNSDATLLLSVINVGKARLTENKLFIHHAPNTTLFGVDLNRNVFFQKENVKWFDVTEKGEIVYQIGSKLYWKDAIYEIGTGSTPVYENSYVFVEGLNDELHAVSLTDGSKKMIEFPPQINKENCTSIKLMANCTVFVADKDLPDPVTTIVIQRNPGADSRPLNDICVDLPNERECYFSDGFIWILGPRGLVYDITNGNLISIFSGLTSDSSMFRDSFISGNHLVCVKDDGVSLWTIEGAIIANSV